MLPIFVPQRYFQVMKKMILGNIWQHKKPIIKDTILSRGKKRGGLGLPDLKKYYEATLLARVVDWKYNNQEKRWVEIEKGLNEANLDDII